MSCPTPREPGRSSVSYEIEQPAGESVLAETQDTQHENLRGQFHTRATEYRDRVARFEPTIMKTARLESVGHKTTRQRKDSKRCRGQDAGCRNGFYMICRRELPTLPNQTFEVEESFRHLDAVTCHLDPRADHSYRILTVRLLLFASPAQSNSSTCEAHHCRVEVAPDWTLRNWFPTHCLVTGPLGEKEPV